MSLRNKLNRVNERYGTLLILILMIVIITILYPGFFSTANLTNIVRQISIIAIIAFGATFVIITGGIDLSAGSIVGITSVIVASLAHPGMYPVIIPIIVGMAVGSLAGVINGVLITKTKIPPFIATLGMMIAARGAALIYSDGRPIGNFTRTFEFIGGGDFLGIPVPIIIVAMLLILSHLLLNNTIFGLYTYAIGSNEQAAMISGINVNKYKVLIYIYAGLMSSIAAIVLTSRISSGQPLAGTGFEMDAIAAAVIGGTSLSGGVGTIPGTFMGALIIGILNNALDLLGVSAYWQQVFKGAIIVGAVVLDQRRKK
ncbi:Ribose import permease protein RbsC [Moorella thermoacetica]|uniref:Ribose/xylose/arabinose/galactoside ABC-type transport systems, permease components n=1 Tax=Moorella thermoacetica Y72 TaxID=1325331 RepID=A0A0S6UFP6_NEOTH|nr:ribose/xylose/arabinose/galactoside ABC-type transport systems, permease components [Moorella thermoacetica Y72]